jgi:hypothetical protein
MIGMPHLLEHFGPLPALLFTAESGTKGDHQGGKGERFFHGLEARKERSGDRFATGNGLGGATFAPHQRNIDGPVINKA